MNYRILTIPETVTRRVRADGRDPVYKHPTHTETATSYGPCRQCLQFFTPGVDRRVLFTYDSFLGVDDKRQPGPVFIHEHECSSYSATREFPEHLSSHSLTLEAYGKGKEFRQSAVRMDAPVQPMIGELFSRPDVDYIIVRDTDAGCFDCAIVRE